MIARAVRLGAALLVALPITGATQVTPRPRDRRPSSQDRIPAGMRDSIAGQRRDTTADTTTKWLPADSVMEVLLKRSGHSITRYEGEIVTFDALTKAFAIAAAADQKAQVEREGQRVITDSTILYQDQTRNVEVRGHFTIAPGSGQPPIQGAGAAHYSLAERAGRLTNARVAVEESGNRWFIESAISKTALGDSTLHIPARMYGLGGTLTSCDDSVPDYHFAFKEIKRTEKTLVARPAVLYLRDIPVMWLPFVFQDIRQGRRSGILPPRFGASDIVRNSPSYRRHIENLGYYWALNDYMDATTWLDWRSSTGGDTTDPGWSKFNAEWKYYWMSRFIQGRFASSYTRVNNGSTNLAVSWDHNEQLGRDRRVTMNINYVTSTQLQRQNTFNPYQALATIVSSVNFSDKIGPASLQLGGTRKQNPGRQEVDQDLPRLSLTTAPLTLASWLIWTPSFNFSESDILRSDQPGPFSARYVGDTSGRFLRADTLRKNAYTRTINFDTPLRIFGTDFRNSVAIRDQVNDFPTEDIVYPNADSSRKETRVFFRTYRTEVDWNPTFALPNFGQNRFKITPTIALSNVDGRPFWVRTELTGGRFVHQNKRLTYGLSAAPTVFGLFPGFGPFTRFRHSISPTIGYNFAPAASVNPEYLAAWGNFSAGYVGALRQSAVSFGLSQNIEAKVRSTDSTQSGDGGQKLKVLSMQFSSLSYDFERARVTGRKLAGLTTESFGTRMTSDLLPGFDLSVDYSLFQGSTLSDTAVFKPFLTRITSGFRISQRDNPFAVITRLFGRAVPDQSPTPQAPSQRDAATERQFVAQPVAGQSARGSQFVVPPAHGWEASFNFSTSRTRPPVGGRVIQFDPRIRCQVFKDVNPFAYDDCLRAAPGLVQPIQNTTAGAPYVMMPRQTSLNSSVNFELTQKWSAAWQTNYDFEQSQFASQVVSLQRDLHDWRAVFAFTHSPNGNFAFNFWIALKPQPDLKFDYSRASVRGY